MDSIDPKMMARIQALRLLTTIIDNYDGELVGAKTLAISIGEEADLRELYYE